MDEITDVKCDELCRYPARHGCYACQNDAGYAIKYRRGGKRAPTLYCCTKHMVPIIQRHPLQRLPKPGGRPSKCEQVTIDLLRKLGGRGATESEMVKMLNVSQPAMQKVRQRLELQGRIVMSRIKTESTTKTKPRVWVLKDVEK